MRTTQVGRSEALRMRFESEYYIVVLTFSNCVRYRMLDFELGGSEFTRFTILDPKVV